MSMHSTTHVILKSMLTFSIVRKWNELMHDGNLQDKGNIGSYIMLDVTCTMYFNVYVQRTFM